MEVKKNRTKGWTRNTVAFSVQLAMDLHARQMAARASKLQKQRGWTNAKLAQEAGLAEKTVSRFINAKHDARADTIRRIAKALGISEGELRGAMPAPIVNSEGPSIETLLRDILERLDRIEAGQIPQQTREALVRLADAADPGARGRGTQPRRPPAQDDPGGERRSTGGSAR